MAYRERGCRAVESITRGPFSMAWCSRHGTVQLGWGTIKDGASVRNASDGMCHLVIKRTCVRPLAFILRKYESDGGPGVRTIAELLREQSSNPAEAGAGC